MQKAGGLIRQRDENAGAGARSRARDVRDMRARACEYVHAQWCAGALDMLTQRLMVTINFPDGREVHDLDCGELDHDLTWEEQVERAAEKNGTPLGAGNGPEWSSLVLIVVNRPSA